VTILTSIDDNECQLLYGATSSAKVIQYARNAKLAGCDGIVCSPLDLPTIKALPELQGLKTIVPGISIYGHVDQKRTATPYYALENGADYIVVGRDILNATNKEAALFDTYRWMYKGLCQRLILTLFNNNHVKFGQFKLKLHEKNPDAPLSPLYLNLRQMNNTILDMITDLMIDIIEDDNITFDAIAGIPKAGTPIAELLADKLQIPHITLSKVEKDDGTRYISGVVTKLNATKVLLVDDLITGADTKLEAIKVLEKENYKVTDLLVTVDRQQGGVTQLDSLGYKTYTVIKLANLLDGLFNANKISINQYEDTRDYLKLPKLAG
jgi:orotate phosphoribosyltransferase